VAWTEGHRSAVARSSEFGLRPLRSTGAHGQGRNRERGEHGDLGSGLTVSRVVVLRPGDDVEAAAETKLDNGSAWALGEGESERGRAVSAGGASPFYRGQREAGGFNGRRSMPSLEDVGYPEGDLRPS
jgi:hypothetical protein